MFLDMDETSLNAKHGTGTYWAYWDPFRLKVALMKHILFNCDSLHAKLNSHCKAWSQKKKKHKKIKAYRKSRQKEPIVNRCLLILDLNPYPKTTEQLNHQMAFCFRRRASLDTRWEVEHFRLFFVFVVAGLVDLG